MRNDKITSLKKIAALRKKLVAGQKIVYAQGFFDLLHVAHIHHLEQAKKLGDILIVGVVADKFAKKGPGRPCFKASDRLAAVASLECVDLVFLVAAPDAKAAIKNIRPDIYVKGEDVKDKAQNPAENLYWEIKAVQSVGGDVRFTNSLVVNSLPIHSTELLNGISGRHLKKAEHAKMDSHKMHLHPEWVARWQAARNNWEKTKVIYPIQMEISLSGACNHRCTFCALDFVNYQPRFIAKDAMTKTLNDMAQGGVKSVMYCGEGEPTLHPDLADILVATKTAGLDAALTTNGSLMNEAFLKKALGSLAWIKVSLDAGAKDTYLKIHRPKNSGDWEQVFDNLKFAVLLKKKQGYKCRLGAQAVLLLDAKDDQGAAVPGNFNEIAGLARSLKNIGLDYFVIKPYSYQPLSLAGTYRNLDYSTYQYPIHWLESELKKIATPKYEVVLRAKTIEKYSQERNYQLCHAIPYAWAYIMADGSVWSCSANLLNKNFYLGNVNERSFKDIWEGEARKKQWQYMKKFSPRNCRKNCVMDKVNDYLWELDRPPYNVNYL